MLLLHQITSSLAQRRGVIFWGNSYNYLLFFTNSTKQDSFGESFDADLDLVTTRRYCANSVVNNMLLWYRERLLARHGCHFVRRSLPSRKPSSNSSLHKAHSATMELILWVKNFHLDFKWQLVFSQLGLVRTPPLILRDRISMRHKIGFVIYR